MHSKFFTPRHRWLKPISVRTRGTRWQRIWRRRRGGFLVAGTRLWADGRSCFGGKKNQRREPLIDPPRSKLLDLCGGDLEDELVSAAEVVGGAQHNRFVESKQCFARAANISNDWLTSGAGFGRNTG